MEASECKLPDYSGRSTTEGSTRFGGVAEQTYRKKGTKDGKNGRIESKKLCHLTMPRESRYVAKKNL